MGEVYPGHDVPNKELYYYGPVTYGYISEDHKVKNLRDNREFTQDDLEEIKESEKAKNKIYEDSINNSVESSGDFTTQAVVNRVFRKVSGVPDYQQSHYPGANDCSPVAAANIIMYWDQNGYPSMSSSNVPANVVERLANFMNTTANGTTGANLEIGLDRYLQERYPSANSDRRGDPSFSNLSTEISAGRPALVHVKGYGYSTGDSSVGHSVTLVGTESYQESSQSFKTYYNIVVHDNWTSTGKEVWLAFERGGGSVYAHTVVFPK
ncbi:C39 family peptidase [Jeotgalibacillus sp. R-1-5s-1]|uniref:C39 family peptidase n=1 Tax=Jeotgalibacillus sp. R-1-5s-1 TaxID=2555897 RepID=UPI00106AC809|nr:C39 family peptidase [Jeotgalibacillus sp. R-1-5s-1]TFD97047.1 hypothetical protein E2491_10150 [Jeotgalibacillus sp. R-1-5s-1]